MRDNLGQHPVSTNSVAVPLLLWQTDNAIWSFSQWKLCRRYFFRHLFSFHFESAGPTLGILFLLDERSMHSWSLPRCSFYREA
jgi:hypothetical protein